MSHLNDDSHSQDYSEYSYDVIYDYVLNLPETSIKIKFNDVQAYFTKLSNQRRLTSKERMYITQAIYKKNIIEHEVINNSINDTSLISTVPNLTFDRSRIMILMGYSEDYSIGAICCDINKRYAKKYGYSFECFVSSHENIMHELHPKDHCTWYKVLLINRLLHSNTMNNGDSINTVDWILWLDADAFVLNDNVLIEDLVVRGKYKDLIIAEDMHPHCSINCGVMLIKNSKWSQELWDDVWKYQRYNNVTYYEQSTLIRLLRTRQEGLYLIHPFHTYVDGCEDKGDKIFAHVAVFPHQDLNTWIGLPQQFYSADCLDFSPTALDHVTASQNSHCKPNFIFHAAGLKNKLQVIKAMTDIYNVYVDPSTIDSVSSFYGKHAKKK